MALFIKANTCPYCGARYGIAWGGCEARCADSERVKVLIREACEAEERGLTDEQQVHEQALRRAPACVTCGYPLRAYDPSDTSTWRRDNYCSARCKRQGVPQPPRRRPTFTGGGS